MILWRITMNNIIGEVEKYREKILKTKKEYRQELAKLSFEKKIEIVDKLKKRAKFLKKFKVKTRI